LFRRCRYLRRIWKLRVPGIQGVKKVLGPLPDFDMG
jgi:hypothetical protein